MVEEEGGAANASSSSNRRDNKKSSSSSNNKMQKANFAGEVSSSGRQRDNKKNKKREKKSSSSKKKGSHYAAAEPDGVLGHAVKKSFYEEHSNPNMSNISFESTSMGTSSGSVLMVDDDHELLPDSFSFLMTARFPFEKKKETQPKPAAEDPIALLEDAGAPKNSKKEHDSDWWCLPFWMGCFIIFLQLFIYSVVFVNTWVGNDPPPNADYLLRLAQAFAMVVTLYTQSDLIDGIFLFTEGWEPFKDISTPFKFLSSSTLRLIAGNFGVVATFGLVMFSTEVVDLLLNFTAIEFVATLDGSAFEIASKGFLGVTLEKKATEIEDFKYKSVTRRRASRTRVLLYVLYAGIVWAAYATMVIRQNRRATGVKNEVYVQFDDTDVPELAGISGVYTGCRNFQVRKQEGTNTGDIGYVDVSYGGGDFSDCLEPEQNNEGDMVFPAKTFLYCFDLEGWVYITKKTNAPCSKENNEHLLRSFLDDGSQNTDSFDILSHAQANWLVIREGQGDVLLDFKFIEGADSEKFQFKSSTCEALLITNSTSRELLYTLYPLPPTEYPRFPERKEDETTSYIDKFGFTYRTVFTSNKDTSPAGIHEIVVLFDGLRWLELFEVNVTEIGWTGFLEKFHRTNNDFSPYAKAVSAISDPMQFLTPGDTGFPTQALKWHEPITSLRHHTRPGREIVDDSHRFEMACLVKPLATCTDSSSLLSIRLTTDPYPVETLFTAFFGDAVLDIHAEIEPLTPPSLLESNFTIQEDTTTILNFNRPGVVYQRDFCVPDDKCVQVLGLDGYGDGFEVPGEYELLFDGDSIDYVVSGTDFTCFSYQVGSGCAVQRTEPAICTQEELDKIVETVFSSTSTFGPSFEDEA